MSILWTYKENLYKENVINRLFWTSVLFPVVNEIQDQYLAFMHAERNNLVRMSKKIPFGDPVEVYLSSNRVKVEFGSGKSLNTSVILDIIILSFFPV